MPISAEIKDGVLITTMDGVVTTPAFLDYYLPLMQRRAYAPLRGELVDGRAITSWQVPATVQRDFAAQAALHVDQLRHLRVAMVATLDYVYGSFRMWELQRADLGYEVRPFRALSPALVWLGLPSDSPPR